MTTYITRTGNQTFNKAKMKPHDRNRLRIAKASHDAASVAIPAANVVNIVQIPANSIILGVSIDVPDNQADTDIKVGVTADDDYFAAVLALDNTGTTITPTTVGTGGGMPYHTNAATNVIITAITNAINAAEIVARVPYIELDAQVAVN